jgi:hypothetical protein
MHRVKYGTDAKGSIPQEFRDNLTLIKGNLEVLERREGVEVEVAPVGGKWAQQLRRW